ncbi:MAG: FmdB family zinc ribbon protein [Bacteroidota bacterium]
MPTYQYKCSHCSHEFEEFQSITDSPLTTCPNCKQDRLYRVIGAGGGMIFKGSGFYLTDYAKNSSDKGGSNTNKDTPAEKKTEAKPADTSSKQSTESKPDK